jgi:hypothetical protein
VVAASSDVTSSPPSVPRSGQGELGGEFAYGVPVYVIR